MFDTTEMGWRVGYVRFLAGGFEVEKKYMTMSKLTVTYCPAYIFEFKAKLSSILMQRCSREYVLICIEKP